MKSLTMIVGLVLFSIATIAQQTVQFHQKYLPKRTYSLSTKTNIDMEVSMSGDSAALVKLLPNGLKPPMQIKTNIESDASLKTAIPTTSIDVPFALSYSRLTENVTVNGVAAPLKGNDALIGKVLSGTIDADEKLNLDTLTIAIAKKEAMRSLENQLPTAIKFPDKRIDIGDSFTIEVPMQYLNIPNFEITKGHPMKVDYRLTSIKDGLAEFTTLAYFEINYSADLNGRTVKVDGQGTGLGKMVYDIKKSFPQYVSSGMKLLFIMIADNDNIITNVNILHEAKYTVSAD